MHGNTPHINEIHLQEQRNPANRSKSSSAWSVSRLTTSTRCRLRWIKQLHSQSLARWWLRKEDALFLHFNQCLLLQRHGAKSWCQTESPQIDVRVPASLQPPVRAHTTREEYQKQTNKQRRPIQPFHTISLGNCCWWILVKTWTMSCNIRPKHKVYKKITARRFSKKFKKILKAEDLNSIKKIPSPVTKPLALTEELADKQYRCLHPKPAAEMFHLLPLALNWEKIAQFLCCSNHLLESCKKTQWLWRIA